MVGWPSGDGWLCPVKAQLAKVKMLDKCFNDSDWVVFGNIIFQILGKQCALHPVIALNKPFHLSSSSRVVSETILQGFQWGNLRFDTPWVGLSPSLKRKKYFFEWLVWRTLQVTMPRRNKTKKKYFPLPKYILSILRINCQKRIIC
jgi:hypothetical protein